MKLAAFNKLCEDLFTQYKADPYELFLTPKSRSELTNEIFAEPETSLVIRQNEHNGNVIIGGAYVDSVVNPVTRSVVDVRLTENDFDSVVVELRIPA